MFGKRLDNTVWPLRYGKYRDHVAWSDLFRQFSESNGRFHFEVVFARVNARP